MPLLAVHFAVILSDKKLQNTLCDAKFVRIYVYLHYL